MEGERRRRACSCRSNRGLVDQAGIDRDTQVIHVVRVGVGRVGAREVAVELREEHNHDAVAWILPTRTAAQQPCWKQSRPSRERLLSGHSKAARSLGEGLARLTTQKVVQHPPIQ